MYRSGAWASTSHSQRKNTGNTNKAVINKWPTPPRMAATSPTNRIMCLPCAGIGKQLNERRASGNRTYMTHANEYNDGADGSVLCIYVQAAMGMWCAFM